MRKQEGNSIIMRAYQIQVFAKLTSEVLGQGNCKKLAKLDTDQLAEVFIKTAGHLIQNCSLMHM